MGNLDGKNQFRIPTLAKRSTKAKEVDHGQATTDPSILHTTLASTYQDQVSGRPQTTQLYG